MPFFVPLPLSALKKLTISVEICPFLVAYNLHHQGEKWGRDEPGRSHNPTWKLLHNHLNTTPDYSPRPFKIRFGIRQKIVLVLVAVLLVAMTIGSWITLREEKTQVLAEVNQRGSDISRFVAKSLSFSVVGYDYHTIQLLLDEIVSSNDVSYARVISIKGNTMGESGTLPATGTGERSTVIFREPIRFEQQDVGSLVLGLETKSTIARLESYNLKLMVRRTIAISLVTIAVFFALSALIIRPLRTISGSLAKGLDNEGKLVEDIPVTSQDELGHLASQFRSLHDQLNRTNIALQSKIESADQKLLESNSRLKLQSEELIKMNEEFRKLAVTDSLTGLYNRRYFERAMQDELAMSKRHGDRHCVLLIDIDFFKNINDTYGHLEGDRVLQNFSMCLKEQLRGTDILCRMGGEEFVVLCRRVDKDDVIRIAEKFRKNIEKIVFRFGADIVRVTVSIGASIFPKGPDDTIDDIVNEADEALYYCKRSGRNRVALFDDLPKEAAPAKRESSESNIHPFPNIKNGEK